MGPARIGAHVGCRFGPHRLAPRQDGVDILRAHATQLGRSQNAGLAFRSAPTALADPDTAFFVPRLQQIRDFLQVNLNVRAPYRKFHRAVVGGRFVQEIKKVGDESRYHSCRHAGVLFWIQDLSVKVRRRQGSVRHSVFSRNHRRIAAVVWVFVEHHGIVEISLAIRSQRGQLDPAPLPQQGVGLAASALSVG